MSSSQHKTTQPVGWSPALYYCLLVTPVTVPLHLAPGVPDPDQLDLPSSDSHLEVEKCIYLFVCLF